MIQLQNILSAIPHTPYYPTSSRVHRLNSFNQPGLSCFVKRDDELCGSMGSKIRKYRTLIPFFLTNKIEQVAIIGSAYSNHVLSLTPLLIENGIQPILFLKGQQERERQGNALFSSLFVKPSAIHWISKTEWPAVLDISKTYALQQSQNVFILAEGGAIPEALPGALSLPLDIVRNEMEGGYAFDHLFIDAGTGLLASALILGFHWMKRATRLHILLLAGSESSFQQQLALFHRAFERLMQTTCPFPDNFTLHVPHALPSFGSTNRHLFKKIIQLARVEGFLTDPIYSGKLFLETGHLINTHSIKGTVLINHSGGISTLAGFQKTLNQLVNFDD